MKIPGLSFSWKRALGIILVARIAYLCKWGRRIKWFFEDICHWLGWNIGSYKEESGDEEK